VVLVAVVVVVVEEEEVVVVEVVVASENVSNSIIEYKHYLFIVSKISRYNAMSVNTISKA
jgi:hypothetical protein